MTKPIKHQLLYRHVVASLQHQDRIAVDENRAGQSRLPETLSATFPLNILVAEDNEINQQVIRYILEKIGYSPTIVANGQEAVDEAAMHHYDIVFMDLQMPEIDGLEATRLIRRSDNSHQPVIIALTANTMEGDEDECLLAGMNDYLGKPVKLEELLGK